MVYQLESMSVVYYTLSTADILDAMRDLVSFTQFKNVKNTFEGMLVLVKLQTEVCNFTKSNIPP